MHGVKRSRLSAQAAEAKRQKEVSKIEAYTSLQDDVLQRKRNKDYSMEAFGRTTSLLDLNPEFYTVWNYRRHILLKGLFPASTAEEIVKLLTADLRLTTAYLQVHPKVYWIWSHRKWCLESVPLGPEGSEGWRNEFWKMELMLIEKMLDVDARNFHAWDYRRYVTRSLPDSFKPQRTEEDELRYTQKKIEANFSNFSAWHCRSKLLGSLWEGFSAEEKTKRRNQELELVQQALWTDPGDQSGWLYHRWLIGQEPNVDILRQELTQTKELLEEAPDSRWCMLALVHYSLLLADLTADQSETTALKEESAKTLERLAEIDADRCARYVDMAKGLI